MENIIKLLSNDNENLFSHKNPKMKYLKFLKSTSINKMDIQTHVAAVDLGATHLRAAIVDRDGTIKEYSQNEVKGLMPQRS